MASRLAPLAALALVALVAGVVLVRSGSGSGGSDGSDSGPSASASVSAPASSAASAGTSAGPSAAPYPSGAATEAAEGTELTDPGAELALGEQATVAWEPRQHSVGVLDLTVTALHRTTFRNSFRGWQLDAKTKSETPYFVEARASNAGRSDLGGLPVPLYGAAASGALIEATSFASSFEPCEPGALPTRFPAGASVDVCLVYLVPDGGTLEGVTFRPTQDFDPITWTGDLTPVSPAGKSTALASSTPSSDNEEREPATPR